MASAWGFSWGGAWGNSWGTIGPSHYLAELWEVDFIPKKKRKKLKTVAEDLRDALEEINQRIKKESISPAELEKAKNVFQQKFLRLSYQYDQLGEQLNALDEIIAVKEKALQAFEKAWSQLKKNAELQEKERQRREDEDIEDLYLLMMVL